MLKLVLDANTIISAFLWDGNEAELFREIENNKAELYSSFEIIKEVEEVLKRPKFSQLITKSGITIDEIIQKNNITISPSFWKESKNKYLQRS